MSKHQKKILWPALLMIVAAVSTVAFVSSRKARVPVVTKRLPSAQNPAASISVKLVEYVRRGLLDSQLTWKLSAFGDRLEKPGKERLAVVGTLARPLDSRSENFSAVLEFPDRLKLMFQNGIQSRVITFNGEEAKAAGKPLDRDETDLIETLVHDTAEHFFSTQMQGEATRFLGSRFRLDDGSDPNYRGPYYDIYQVTDDVKAAADLRVRAKRYYFNSDSLLLERVRYQITRGGATVEVETLLGGWQKEQRQQIARRIERRENGRTVAVIILRDVSTGPRANDGSFVITSGQ